MAQTVNIPGVGRVRFPDGMSQQDIAVEADRLFRQAQQSGGGEVEGGTGRQARAQAPSPARQSPPGVPFGAVQPGSIMIPGLPFDIRTLFENVIGPLPDRDPQGFAQETLPVAGATAASAAFPPAAIARGVPWLMRGLNLLKSAGIAGTGGAVGGAGGGLLEGEDVGEAALRGGRQMATAEGIGRAATGLGARVIAPAVGLLDDTGRMALKFARGERVPDTQGITGREMRPRISPEQVAPGSAQNLSREAMDILIPARFITQRRRRMVLDKVLDVPTDTQNALLRRLVGADTREEGLTGIRTVAKRTANALGDRRASDLGFDRLNPRDFISRVFQSGDPAALRKRLGDEGFSNLLTANLEAMLTRATRQVGKRRVIDGSALMASWRAVPDKVKALYPEKTREAFENYAAFAAASAGIPELAQQGAINVPSGFLGLAGTGGALFGGLDTSMIGGLGAGVSALLARALMSPTSLTNRWLTNEKLGPDAARVAGREITKLIPRRLLAEPSEEDDASVPAGGLLGP